MYLFVCTFVPPLTFKIQPKNMISTSGSVQLVNTLHQLKGKSDRLDPDQKLRRQWNRLFEILGEEGIVVDSPEGQKYDPARTDLDVTIQADTDSPVILEVIKPVIYRKTQIGTELLQRGVVIAG